MKPSLEEERRALLAQIEASRAGYRRMLAGQSEEQVQNQTQYRDGPAAAGRLARGSPGFPRSRTVQWIMDHPMTVAAGVAILVWAVPRIIEARSRANAESICQTVPEHAREQVRGQKKTTMHAHENRPAPAQGSARALITAATLLLRSPATIRTVISAASTAWQWLQEQRQHRAQTPLTSRHTR